MAWYSCLSTCRETTTKRTYPLEVRCGLQNEPKSRNFVRKIEKIFFSHIISESSKTYRKPILKYFWIFFWKNIHLGLRKISKKWEFLLLLKSTQNLLKRMVNRFFVEKHTKKTTKIRTVWQIQFDYISSPVTSGGGQPYNPCGFVTDLGPGQGPDPLLWQIFFDPPFFVHPPFFTKPCKKYEKICNTI